MKLLGRIESKVNKDKNVNNLHHLEITGAILVHYNIVNNDYRPCWRILYAFTPNKSFFHLLDISSKTFIFLKTFNSELSHIEIWLTDQNSKLLEIEDKANITWINN